MERLFGCDAGKRQWLVRERGFDLMDMAEVFADASRLDVADDRSDYGEERRVAVGVALGRLFTVVYTIRGPVTWLITAWRPIGKSAHAMAQAESVLFTRLADGTLLQRQPDGTFRPTASHSDRDRLASLSDAEIEAMSASDPDHPGLDTEFWARAGDFSRDTEAVSITLDRDVLGFFREDGRDYQTRINAVLRGYMRAKTRVD